MPCFRYEDSQTFNVSEILSEDRSLSLYGILVLKPSQAGVNYKRSIE